MEMDLSVIEVMRQQFTRHETIEEDLDLIASMRRSAHSEEQHAKMRGAAIDEFLKDFFSTVAEAWECSYEEAIDNCGKLLFMNRHVFNGEITNKDTINLLPYKDYLKSAHWQGIREYALLRADYRCQICNSPDSLEVHHRTYERKGREDYRDVIALCHKCHAKFHGKG